MPDTFISFVLPCTSSDVLLQLGGSPYTVLLGRRDSTTASLNLANSDLPTPSSNLTSLISGFARKGLSTTDMVALSGACYTTDVYSICPLFVTEINNK
jgi:peroxidase